MYNQSNKQKKISNNVLIYSTLLVAALIVGCSPKKESTSQPRNSNDGYQETNSIFLDGKVVGKMTKKVLSSQEKEEQAKEYQNASISDIPVDASHNAQVFKISGMDSSQRFYTAPKIFVYGSAYGKAVENKNADGSINVPFNVALISGLNDTVVGAADGAGSDIKVNENLKIKNSTMMVSNLKAKYGESTMVTPLPGCPKKIYLSAIGKNYDVTPSLFKEGDYCELEKPFTVNFTVNSNELDSIFEAIEHRQADIFVRYDVRVPVIKAAVSVNLDRKRVYELLQGKLQGNYKALVQGEIEVAIQKVLSQMNINVFMVGSANETSKKIYDRMLTEFFEPMMADPKLSESSPCRAAACFSLKKVENSETREFNMAWVETEGKLVDMRFISMAKLVSGNQIIYNPGTKDNPITNTAKTNFITLPISPTVGDIFVLRPIKYEFEDRRREDTQVGRSETGYCEEWFMGMCKRQGVRTTTSFTHSYDPLTHFSEVSNVMSGVQDFFSGISLEFRYTNQSTITCKILDMKGFGIVDGRSIDIRPTPSCPLDPNLDISGVKVINNIIHPSITYIAGSKTVKNFENGGSSNYHEESYSPQVRVQMSLTHKLRSITSGNSSTSRN